MLQAEEHRLLYVPGGIVLPTSHAPPGALRRLVPLRETYAGALSR